MAIDVDLSREIRGVDGLRGLVRAVLAAHESDEASWIEWKSDVDLDSGEGCMKMATQILGLANRPVEEAARTCAGFGYLVVGAEPGSLSGVKVPDPAEWVSRVEKYVNGDTSPVWAPTTIPVDGVHVLVVSVDPPQNGDPIWTVRKERTPVRSGAVYVRKPGRTELANADDMDVLQRRLLARTEPLPDLSVELVGDFPLSWLDGASTSHHLREWVDQQREEHAAQARAVDEERRAPDEKELIADRLDALGVAGTAYLRQQAQVARSIHRMSEAMSTGLGRTGPEPDQRSLEEYLDLLDSWSDELFEAAKVDLPRRYFKQGHGLARVRITNNSTQYLTDVQVQIHIDDPELEGFDWLPDGERLPQPPRPFGTARPDRFAGLLSGNISHYVAPVVDYGSGHPIEMTRDTWIEDGSIHLTVDVGDLRPLRYHTGDEFFILLRTRPASGVVAAHWTATVKDRDWIVEGRFEIPVAETPWSIASVFETHENDDLAG